jgi:hypothetical protein
MKSDENLWGRKLLKGVTRSLTETDDSMFTGAVPRLRYPPTAQQFATRSPEACTTSHTGSGRLRIFLRIVRRQPLILGQPCEPAEASKALGVSSVSDFRLLF